VRRHAHNKADQPWNGDTSFISTTPQSQFLRFYICRLPVVVIIREPQYYKATKSVTVLGSVNIVCQILGSLVQYKQEISNTAIEYKCTILNTTSCLQVAFYILTFYVLILNLHFNFNLNNFSNILITRLFWKANTCMFTIYWYMIRYLCLYNIIAPWWWLP
jgi:hypothetical protein